MTYSRNVGYRPGPKENQQWQPATVNSVAALPKCALRRIKMSLGLILLIIVVLMLIGSIPSWSHSRNWGYGPSGGIGLVLVILIVLLLMGRL